MTTRVAVVGGGVSGLSAAHRLRALLPGASVTVLEQRNVTFQGKTVPVLRTRVTRERGDYIDLYFADTKPSYLTPDLWVDWPGNQREMYPDGTPYDVVPSSSRSAPKARTRTSMAERSALTSSVTCTPAPP